MRGEDGAVYKFASTPKKAPALKMEALVNEDLRMNFEKFGLKVDEIQEVGENGVFLKKRYYDPKQLGSNIEKLSPEQIRGLEKFYDGAVLYAKERGIGLDIKSENLWWDGSAWVLIDCGPRLGYRPFGYTLDIGSFARYLRWWNKGEGAPLNSNGTSKTVEQALQELQ